MGCLIKFCLAVFTALGTITIQPRCLSLRWFIVIMLDYVHNFNDKFNQLLQNERQNAVTSRFEKAQSHL